jgi:glycosyltransferase involved in cell wall biosynthesis
MKLMVLSHALIQPHVQTRWRKLAKSGAIQVRLVVPKQWGYAYPGMEEGFVGVEEDANGFQIRTAHTINKTNCSIYLFRGLRKQLRDFDADIIYPTHESLQTVQMVLWRWLFARRSRLVYFTMSVHPRVPALTWIKPWRRPWRIGIYLLRAVSWWLLRHGTDAAVCHYPAIKEQLRREGYKRPILIQTQVGIDEEVFCPDTGEGEKIRARLGLTGFVVGFVGRITEEKGVLDIAEAVGRMPNDVHFLVIGGGPDQDRLMQLAAKGGWAKRLHLTGVLPIAEVASHMRAMDCLVVASRTTEGWVDTFPNVLAQAMSTGLPVIGSNSGAIPFMLGGKGLLFAEGSVSELVDHLQSLREKKDLRASMGAALRERALAEFCLGGINASLVDFLKTVAQGKRS